MFRTYHKRYREESFAVLLRKLSDDSAGVDIATPATYQDLSEILDLFKEQAGKGASNRQDCQVFEDRSPSLSRLKTKSSFR